MELLDDRRLGWRAEVQAEPELTLPVRTGVAIVEDVDRWESHGEPPPMRREFGPLKVPVPERVGHEHQEEVVVPRPKRVELHEVVRSQRQRRPRSAFRRLEMWNTIRIE